MARYRKARPKENLIRSVRHRERSQPNQFSPMTRARQAVLQHMGYADYTEYLSSPLWASIRKTVLDRDNWQCCACSQRAIQVHHCRYDLPTLSGRDLSQLKSICVRCHSRIERSGRRKCSLAEANTRLMSLIMGRKQE